MTKYPQLPFSRVDSKKSTHPLFGAWLRTPLDPHSLYTYINYPINCMHVSKITQCSIISLNLRVQFSLMIVQYRLFGRYKT